MLVMATTDSISRTHRITNHATDQGGDGLDTDLEMTGLPTKKKPIRKEMSKLVTLPSSFSFQDRIGISN